MANSSSSSSSSNATTQLEPDVEAMEETFELVFVQGAFGGSGGTSVGAGLLASLNSLFVSAGGLAIKRYFVVVTKSLSTIRFYGEDKAALKGEIEMSLCQRIDTDCKLPSSLKPRPNTFLIELKTGERFFFIAEKRITMLQWVATLRDWYSYHISINSSGRAFHVQEIELFLRQESLLSEQISYVVEFIADPDDGRPLALQSALSWKGQRIVRDDEAFTFFLPRLASRLLVTLYSGESKKLKKVAQYTLSLSSLTRSEEIGIVNCELQTDASYHLGTLRLHYSFYLSSTLEAPSYAATHPSLHKFYRAPPHDVVDLESHNEEKPWKIFVGSWNVGNTTSPPLSKENGLGWLDQAYDCDIVVIASQESLFIDKDKTKMAATGPSNDDSSAVKHVSLLQIAVQMRDPKNGVECKERSFFFKKFPKCFLGNEAVAWLMEHHIAGSVEEAVSVGSSMLENGYFSHAEKALHCLVNEKVPYQWLADQGPFSAAEWKKLVETHLGDVKHEQELVSGEPTTDIKSLTGWHTIALPSLFENDFALVGSKLMLEISLCVFVRKQHITRHAVDISFDSVATGLAGFIPNKGGVFAELCFDGLRLGFVSSHLAAHQDLEFLYARNENVKSILNAIQQDGLDMYAHVHHLFWAGDLNYRIDLPLSNPSLSLTHEEHFDAVKKLVDQQKWEALLNSDQLEGERMKGSIFCGFSEPRVSFAPTFKVSRGLEVSQYHAKRIPSYCDRVLVHSLPSRSADIAPIIYESAPLVCTSDHKPVFAIFEVNKMPKQEQKPVSRQGSEATHVPEPRSLALRGLRLSLLRDALPSSWPASSRIAFHSEKLLSQSPTFSAPLVSASNGESWSDFRFPSMHLSCIPWASREELCLHDLCAAIHCGALGNDERPIIGQALVPLTDCLTHDSWTFKCPITSRSVWIGFLVGEVVLHDPLHPPGRSRLKPSRPPPPVPRVSLTPQNPQNTQESESALQSSNSSFSINLQKDKVSVRQIHPLVNVGSPPPPAKPPRSHRSPSVGTNIVPLSRPPLSHLADSKSASRPKSSSMPDMLPLVAPSSLDPSPPRRVRVRPRLRRPKHGHHHGSSAENEGGESHSSEEDS